MGDTGANERYQEPKVSLLAIVSFLIPLVLFILPCCVFVVLRNRRFYNFIHFFLLLNFLAFGLSPVTFILAVLSLIRIGRNRALLRGFTISILGILTSAVAFYTSIRAIGTIRPEAQVMLCASNMLEIGEALHQYSDEFDNRYPTPNRWCDLLREHTDVKYANEGKVLFCCPGTRWRAHHAINPNCNPNSPPNTVLVFETNNGWNQFGGPEMLSLDNHYRQGSNILFNNGHVKFVRPRGVEKLKWKAE